MKRVTKKDLQKRVDQLEADLREVVLRPSSFKSTIIKSRILIESDILDAVWFGQFLDDKPGFSGLFKKIAR